MIYFALHSRSRTVEELIRRFDGQAGLLAGQLARPGDLIVNWGARSVAPPAGVTVLNRTVPSKLGAIRSLTEAGVRTVRLVEGQDDWLIRDASHQAGQDLLRDRFLVHREPITEEYRVHSFRGLSIRVARKVPARADHHPWIRTHRTGWKFDYRRDAVPKGARKLAHQAIQSLGMDFGAVDLAQLEDGSLMVLEVNSAPGLEGRGFDVYRRAIQGALNG